MTPLRVVLVDDHPLFRSGLRGVVERMPDAVCLGEAADGAAAVALVAADPPDVVLMDLHMPGVGGVEATRRIVATHPRVAVIVLTMLEDDATILDAVRAGARGYLLKGADEVEIAAAVRLAGSGGAVFGADIAPRALAALRRGTPAPAFPQLSDREREVLALVAEGLPNTAIAARLHLGHQTVRNYVSAVLAKIEAADRAEAIVRARKAGLTGTG